MYLSSGSESLRLNKRMISQHLFQSVFHDDRTWLTAKVLVEKVPKYFMQLCQILKFIWQKFFRRDKYVVLLIKEPLRQVAHWDDRRNEVWHKNTKKNCLFFIIGLPLKIQRHTSWVIFVCAACLKSSIYGKTANDDSKLTVLL